MVRSFTLILSLVAVDLGSLNTTAVSSRAHVNKANKTIIVINGTSPGPVLRAYLGDWIEVLVQTTIPNDNTTIHWHGFSQKGTPWADGVPGFTQCALAAAASVGCRAWA